MTGKSLALVSSSNAALDLAAQAGPYFVKVANAAWIGYRKPLSGSGSWVTDQMTRATLPSFGPAVPAGSNVVPMTKRDR